MLLNELFKPGSGRILKWGYDQKSPGMLLASFATADGEHSYEVSIELANKDGMWLVMFSHVDPEDGEHTTDITPVGSNAVSVFATVHDIVRDAIQKRPIKSLMFSAKEPSRIKLYHRLAKQFNPDYQTMKFGDNTMFKVPVAR